MTATRLRAPLDRLIVKLDEKREQTEGGIYLPNGAQEQPRTGVVVSAGPGTKDQPMSIVEGETVFFGKYAGTDIEHCGDKFVVIREDDVVAVA